MCRLHRVIILIASIAVLAAASWPEPAWAQRRRPPSPPAHAQPRHTVNRGVVVFVGGYFYDPAFGQYPWWPRAAYPYPYYPVYDDRAVVRVQVTPDEAAVYVDGFYAGIVDDFNGFFQGLPLPPGGHEIVVFLEGYRTIRQRIYLGPGSTFKLQDVMERLVPGELSEPPTIAPPIPPPPTGTFIPPRTGRPAPLPPASLPPATATRGEGTLSVRVQPAGAEVFIDEQCWASSDGEHFVVQVPAGTHLVSVAKIGFRRYSAEVQVREGETTPLNVSLTPERSGSGALERRDH
jgi:hypothetical protein